MAKITITGEYDPSEPPDDTPIVDALMRQGISDIDVQMED